MKNIINALKIIVLAVIFSFSVSLVYAWVPPTVLPPNGNTPAPINVSDVTQTKAGGFNILGPIGIGTATPSGLFDVYGTNPASVVIRSGSTCNAGETPLEYQTLQRTCFGGSDHRSSCVTKNCTTGYHSWDSVKKPVETCEYVTHDGKTNICSAQTCSAREYVKCAPAAKISVFNVADTGSVTTKGDITAGGNAVANDFYITSISRWASSLVTGVVSTAPTAVPIDVSATAQTKAGSLSIGGNLKVGGEAVTCATDTAGTIRYEGGFLKLCNGQNFLDIATIPPPPAPPTVKLSLSAPVIAVGQSTILNSNSTDSTSCTVVGGTINQNISPGSGSLTVTPATNTKYTVTCQGPSGTASATIGVDVRQYLQLWNASQGIAGESCYGYLSRLGYAPVNNSNLMYWGSKAWNPTHNCYYDSGGLGYEFLDYHTKKTGSSPVIGGSGWVSAY